jgi:signal transduction histidine kinase
MGREKRSVEGAKKTVNESGPWAELLAFTGELAGGTSARKGLERLARFASRALGATYVLVLVRRGDRFELAGGDGLDEAPERKQILAYGRRLAGWVERTRTPILVSEPSSDTRFPDPPGSLKGAEVFPLLASGTALGALVTIHDHTIATDTVDPPERELVLGFLARLGALALDRDGIQEELRSAATWSKELEKELLAARRLAAAGELALDMGRELKAPLTGLGALAARVAGSMDEADPRYSLLEVIVQESARLDRILGAQLEFGASPDPDLRPEDLNRILSECLTLVTDDLRSRRIGVTKRLGAQLPSLLVDPDLMRRVFLNILRAGMDSAADGGRMKLESKRNGDRIEVLLAADGTAEPGQTLDNLWKPFRVHGKDGEDVTSAGIRQILEEHRGILRVYTTKDWPLVFSIVLPIPGNQDRRQGSPERRARRERRKA